MNAGHWWNKHRVSRGRKVWIEMRFILNRSGDCRFCTQIVLKNMRKLVPVRRMSESMLLSMMMMHRMRA
jgi:hypothetical protein